MSQSSNSVIDQFVDKYRNSWSEYQKIADSVCADLKRCLDDNGIMFIVSSRAKDPDRLKAKILKKEAEAMAEGKGPFKTEQDIWDVIHDAVGARIALYFPGDTSRIRYILQEYFDCIGQPKYRPPIVGSNHPLVQPNTTVHVRKIYPGYDNRRFDGYMAVHHRIRYKTPLSDLIPNPDIEVQVASVLMHAWSEVEHDLAYKKMTGAVSREEYECLDEINGLVIAGEIALNRLNRLSKQRQRMLKTLKSPTSLDQYLEEWMEQHKGRPLDAAEKDGTRNVKQLFDMYELMDMLSPEYVEAQLKRLSPNIPDTLPDLITSLINQFYRGNKKIAKQFVAEKALEYAGEYAAFYTMGKLTNYQGKWNALEELVLKVIRSQGIHCPSIQDAWKILAEEKVLPEELTNQLETLHLHRNVIVITNRLPHPDLFRQHMEDMVNLSKKLKETYNLK